MNRLSQHRSTCFLWTLSFCTIWVLNCPSLAFGAPPKVQTIRHTNDIEYAKVDEHRLLLDLYMPVESDRAHPAPIIVWIHGGAWRSGSKSNMPLMPLVDAGFAVASVDYRLSPTARFPAQIHDCKAAVRFLRANATIYGFDAKQIGIAGSSAGGHLVALMGVSSGHKELEGNVGGHKDQSSSVQAVVDYYGPTNFETILRQSTPHGLSVRVPALKLLLGNDPQAVRGLTRLASPVFHVDSDDAPLLLLHGDQDPQVPINQSHELHAKYNEQNLEVQFHVVHGGGHGGDLFFDNKRITLVTDFFTKHLCRK